MQISVCEIFAIRRPPQIASAVIFPVSVVVRDYVLGGWFIPMECFANQLMN